MKRREFFTQGVRWVILSGIGLMTAFLGANHKIVNADECAVSTVCKSCGKFGRCELPKAKNKPYGK